MLVTNIGARIDATNVGGPCLEAGTNNVQPALWAKAKEHRAVQAWIKMGRLIEGPSASGTVPPSGEAGSKSAPAFPQSVSLSVPQVSEPKSEPVSEPQPVIEQPTPLDLTVHDAMKMVRACEDIDKLKDWYEDDTRKMVRGAIETRLERLERNR